MEQLVGVEHSLDIFGSRISPSKTNIAGNRKSPYFLIEDTSTHKWLFFQLVMLFFVGVLGSSHFVSGYCSNHG